MSTTNEQYAQRMKEDLRIINSQNRAEKAIQAIQKAEKESYELVRSAIDDYNKWWRFEGLNHGDEVPEEVRSINELPRDKQAELRRKQEEYVSAIKREIETIKKLLRADQTTMPSDALNVIQSWQMRNNVDEMEVQALAEAYEGNYQVAQAINSYAKNNHLSYRAKHPVFEKLHTIDQIAGLSMAVAKGANNDSMGIGADAYEHFNEDFAAICKRERPKSFSAGLMWQPYQPNLNNSEATLHEPKPHELESVLEKTAEVKAPTTEEIKRESLNTLQSALEASAPE